MQKGALMCGLVRFKVHAFHFFFLAKSLVFGEAKQPTGQPNLKRLLIDTPLKLLSFENRTIEKDDPKTTC